MTSQENLGHLVLPDYGGASISSLIPAIFGPRGLKELPAWMPQEAVGAKRTVLLIVDGLGWHQLNDRLALAPTLSSMVATRITSVAPTTTATALTSITTGLSPGEHGVVGYRMQMDTRIMNTLRWGDEKGDLRRTFPPRDVQPCPPFFGESVPVISKAELEGSGFTEAHLQGVRHHGWRVSSSIAVIIERLLRDGENFVYAYYDGIDKIAHERGFGPYYDAELETVDALVSSIIARLPADTALFVTADHGQVQVDDNIVYHSDEILRHVRAQSGEGRFRWLHVKRGQEADLESACRETYGNEAWVVSRQQLVDEKWMGNVVRPETLRRLGDVALVPFTDTTFFDPADSGPFQLICRHGAMTSAEVHVPLLLHRS